MSIFAAGSKVKEPYLNDESTDSVDSLDDEEREWKRQGLTDRQIFQIIEERVRRKHENAQAGLQAKLRGAKNFSELLEKYSVNKRRSNQEDESSLGGKTITFAIPELPNDRRRTMSINSSTSGMSISAIAFSTPRDGKEVPLQKLKEINISHVLNVSELDLTKTTIHSATVRINLSDKSESARAASDNSADLQGTFVIRRDSDENDSRRTFIVERNSPDKSDGSLQGTFVVRRNSDGNHSEEGSLQETTCQSRPMDDIPQKCPTGLFKNVSARKSLSILTGSIQNSRDLSKSIYHGNSCYERNEMATPIRNEREGRQSVIESYRYNTTPGRISACSDYVQNSMRCKQQSRQTLTLNGTVEMDVDSEEDSVNVTEGEELEMSNATDRDVKNAEELESSEIDEEESFDAGEDDDVPSKLDVEPCTEDSVEYSEEREAHGIEHIDGLNQSNVIESEEENNSEVQSDVHEDSEDDHESNEEERAESQNVPSKEPSAKRTPARRARKTQSNASKFLVITPVPKRTRKASRTASHPTDDLSNLELQLQKREIIAPEKPLNGERRSARCRVAPVRWWLGELPKYENSPSGGRRLTGVTDVVFSNREISKYGTIDPQLAVEKRSKAKTRVVEEI